MARLQERAAREERSVSQLARVLLPAWGIGVG